ncbi:MAG: dihydrolipoyl dehydrogenase [Candidatus Cryptobacteroides sp.]
MMKLLIIGAGPGGYETAVAASKHGLDVTIVSDGSVGGTCLNEGCIPTKSLCRNAEVLDILAESSVFGIDNLSYSFDFKKVIARKNEVVTRLKSGVEFLLESKNITLIYGKAVFKDAHTVAVTTPEGKETALQADKIIIATGSYPASLPIPGAELEGVISSKEILELEEAPRRLCVIGAGVIGLEFASIFKSFGSEVNVIEYCKDILPRFDVDLAKRLKHTLSNRGISIETSAQVMRIDKTDDGLEVTYKKKDKEIKVIADKVLMAVGRRPNVLSVRPDATGLEFTPKGIVVDSNMRTNVPGIYAIGDVTGGMMLAHVATFQGFKALADILGESREIDFSVVPAAVFTNPEVGVVGMTEEECKEKGLQIKCLKSFFRANGKALSMNAPEGYCKLIVYIGEDDHDLQHGRILGCHIMGVHASDIIQEIAVIMNTNATISDFQNVIHAHPTLTEVVQEASFSF